MDMDSDCSAAKATPPPRAANPRVSLPDQSALLKTKIHLALNRVMAMYLSHLEQLGDEHDEAMGKLIDALPEAERAKVHLADIYGQVRFDAIRRYVLKAGNDACRELEEAVDFLRLT